MATFYQKFEAICRARGKRPSELAEECGFSKAAVSYWRNGRNGASAHSLERLASALGIPEEDLRGDPEVPEEFPDPEPADPAPARTQHWPSWERYAPVDDLDDITWGPNPEYDPIPGKVKSILNDSFKQSASVSASVPVDHIPVYRSVAGEPTRQNYLYDIFYRAKNDKVFAVTLLDEEGLRDLRIDIYSHNPDLFSVFPYPVTCFIVMPDQFLMTGKNYLFRVDGRIAEIGMVVNSPYGDGRRGVYTLKALAGQHDPAAPAFLAEDDPRLEILGRIIDGGLFRRYSEDNDTEVDIV